MGTIYRYRARDGQGNYVEWNSSALDPHGHNYKGEAPFEELVDVLMIRTIEYLEEEPGQKMLLDLTNEDIDEGDTWEIEYQEGDGDVVKICGYVSNDCLCPTTPVPMSAFEPDDWEAMVGDPVGLPGLTFDASGMPVIDNAKLEQRTEWTIPDLDICAPGSWKLSYQIEVLEEENRVEYSELFGFGLYSHGMNQKGGMWNNIGRIGRQAGPGITTTGGDRIEMDSKPWDILRPGVFHGSFSWTTLLKGDARAALQSSSGLNNSDTLLLMWGTKTLDYPESMGDWSGKGTLPLMRFMAMAVPQRICGVHFRVKLLALSWSPLRLEQI